MYMPENERKTNITASNVVFKSSDIYCLSQHFKAYYEQCVKEKTADFAEPCEKCTKLMVCGGNWMDKILPKRLQEFQS